MKEVPVKLGPLTLLLTVISICLTTLAILNFTTARADLRLAERFAGTVETRYALEAQGQAFLREIDGAGPDDPALAALERDSDGVYWYTAERDGAFLRIGLVEGETGFEPVAWRQEKEWEQDEFIEDLWTGPGF